MVQILKKINEFGLVPVVKIEQADSVNQLGKALIKGGLPCAEITFRTDAAESAIRSMAIDFPEILVGAGTVLCVEQAERAVKAGAKFIVSPGFNSKVVDWCVSNGVPITPGVATPTEIDMALNIGLKVLKFFPAELIGGVQMLNAIAEPYSGIKFIPTGGITAKNLSIYLALPNVVACGGSWVVNAQLISAGDFDEITNRIREAVDIIKKNRQQRGDEWTGA